LVERLLSAQAEKERRPVQEIVAEIAGNVPVPWLEPYLATPVQAAWAELSLEAKTIAYLWGSDRAEWDAMAPDPED